MKILVSGGSGFIGTNFVDDLLQRGYDVFNVDIKRPSVQMHEPFWIECDILDTEHLAEVFRDVAPQLVVHLAARTDTVGQRIEDYAVNTSGTFNILQELRKSKHVERVIFVSSQFVHQGKEMPRHDCDFYPYTAYGESKAIGERIVRSAGLDCVWVIVRPTNIWGPWHPRYANEFWRVMARGYYFHPTGPVVTRSFGYVGNVVYQLGQILAAAPEVVRESVFYLGDEPIDLYKWVDAFSIGLTGKNARTVPRALIFLLAVLGNFLSSFNVKFPITVSRYRSMTTNNAAPMEKTFSVFGKPPISLDQGVSETIEWLRSTYPNFPIKRAF